MIVSKFFDHSLTILAEGIPRLRWFGRECDYNVLVIDLLGSNLEELHLDLDRKFTLSTILKLAMQMVSKS